MQIVLFTLVAAALYFFADWVLRTLEARRGAPFPNRSLLFFAIIMPLALIVFELMDRLGPAM